MERNLMKRDQRRAEKKKGNLLGFFGFSAFSCLSATGYTIADTERAVVTRLTRHDPTCAPAP
jgi:hypothetical protein